MTASPPCGCIVKMGGSFLVVGCDCNNVDDTSAAAYWCGIMNEREACAKVVENIEEDVTQRYRNRRPASSEIAAAIRART